jgi:hypothetical protein
MVDGSVARALERGEKGAMPPVIYLQGTPMWRIRVPISILRCGLPQGGRAEQHFFEGVGEAFVKKAPKSVASIACIDKIIEFVHRDAGLRQSAAMRAQAASWKMMPSVWRRPQRTRLTPWRMFTR